VVLLKGPQTHIAAPDGRFAVNRHASPWLATAGSGDVLTGMICGLAAQGVTAFDAASMAAWLHGDIGVQGGPGLTADNMIGHIPLVLRGCLHDESEDGSGSRT
jgi:NAD(P)H-hydrate epimerase